MKRVRLRRTAVVVAVLALGLGLGASLGACGGREEPQTGNPGQGPQSPGANTGTNPAQAAQTATSDTSTLGVSIKPGHKRSSK
jgi:hypothetical protein